jgi:hypothetical protein
MNVSEGVSGVAQGASRTLCLRPPAQGGSSVLIPVFAGASDIDPLMNSIIRFAPPDPE